MLLEIEFFTFVNGKFIQPHEIGFILIFFLNHLAKSVDFPAFPPSSNYIRGYNHACGYVCSPLQE